MDGQSEKILMLLKQYPITIYNIEYNFLQNIEISSYRSEEVERLEQNDPSSYLTHPTSDRPNYIGNHIRHIRMEHNDPSSSSLTHPTLNNITS
uniref:Uncharacterized protein n=1 Tax=Megaselia scalaris TaxID=36166 RepID=T1H4L1_MEGSC